MSLLLGLTIRSSYYFFSSIVNGLTFSLDGNLTCRIAINLGVNPTNSHASAEKGNTFMKHRPRVRFPVFILLLMVRLIYCAAYLEESGKRLEHVDRAHLVLASGKLVQQILLSRVNVWR